MNLIPVWQSVRTVIIGMLHLPALPGSPRYAADRPAIRDRMLRDAETLAAGGVHGMMIENFGDVPFFPSRVPAEAIAHMTAIAAEIKRRVPLPLGINVLRNDGLSALAIAHAVGAEYIRVNVLCGARVADQGLLQGIAHDLLRLRASLGATHIKILADVDVKHSAPLAARPIEDEVDDTLERGLADALVVSGAGTGKATDLEKLRRVKTAASRPKHTAPVFVGSGVTPETARAHLPHADGLIVGTSLKVDGNPHNPVDPARIAALVRAIA